MDKQVLPCYGCKVCVHTRRIKCAEQKKTFDMHIYFIHTAHEMAIACEKKPAAIAAVAAEGRRV